MNWVKPLTEMEVDSIYKELSKYDIKYTMTAHIGIEYGFRVSDILSMHVRDVSGDEIRIKERKTGKQRTEEVKPNSKALIRRYKAFKRLRASDYLIPSGKRLRKPLTRSQAWRVFKAVGNSLGISDLGTHSLRKTFACLLYDTLRADGMDALTAATAVQARLLHDNLGTTMRYLFR